MIDEPRIEEMLRRFEGPPTPRQRRRANRKLVLFRRPVLGVATVLLAAGLATGAVVLRISHSGSRPAKANPRAASCGAGLQFQGNRYVGTRISFPMKAEVPVGQAMDSCSSATVTVNRVGEIDPQLAVAVSGSPGIVYVAAGRCAGFDGLAFEDCLREPLDYQGARYVATRLLGPVSRAGALGPGTLAGRPAEVERLVGIAPSRAVSVASAPADVVYLAQGVCPLPGLDRLERCLQSG